MTYEIDNSTNGPSTLSPVGELKIGEHAKLSFEDVQRNGPPSDPLPEIQPLISRCQRRPRVRVLPREGGAVRQEFVYLKREGDSQFVYRRTSQKKPIKVHFGHVIFGIQLVRVSEGLYSELTGPTWVAIKKLNKEKVREALSRGHHENPYVAIHRMQTLGDDEHVLSCIEALEDDKYLYTIMPFCEGKSIMDVLECTAESREEVTRKSMKQVWENLHYLQSHGIVHHDLSPDNVLLLRGKLVLMDLAMSFQVPTESRTLVKPQGVYGKLAFMPPEVYMNQSPFDGFAMDLWSSGCILYLMLTGGYPLYLAPHPSDMLFRYSVMARGLSNEPMNSRTIEVMIEAYQASEETQDRQALLTRAMKHVEMSFTSKDLLDGMMRLPPNQRYNLEQVLEHDWTKGKVYAYQSGANVVMRDQ